MHETGSLANVVRRNWRALAAIVAISTDACIVLATFCVASRIALSRVPLADLLDSHSRFLLFSLIVIIVAFTAIGQYRIVAYIPPKRHFLNAIRTFFYSGTIILCTLFVFQNSFYTREFIAAFFILLPILYACVWSTLRFLRSKLGGLHLGRWNTLVVGFDKSVDRMSTRMTMFPELGYDVIRLMKSTGPSDGLLHVNQEEVETVISSQGIEHIVLSSSHLNGSFDTLEDLCRRYNIRMSLVSNESDDLFARTNIYDLAGIPVFTPHHRRLETAKGIIKRGFDIVTSCILLILLSPLFLLIAIATRSESKGPVFFKQLRALSDNDKPFEFYKFRSMHHTADEAKESLIDLNESDGALFKIKNDPRLTRVGRFIRRHSFDELPQLVNVLKGEMSLVGPRPLPVKDFKLLNERDHLGGYFRNRSRAKPGMTGLWQISGRSDLGFREMVLLDLYYVEHQTLLFDIEILVQTVPAVLFGKGAY
ncbi:MAG: exopolysaccharide biosynthesis polyprenyl glycosylphosphotransferase [Bacteroidota bacterium]